MQVAIIKYNAGNIRSVEHALRRLGVDPVITADKDLLRAADRVIFPGVGEAVMTMENLRSTGLDRLIVDLKQPVLGICLGLQLMCRSSEEGNVSCLNIFDTDIRLFKPTRKEDKVPHIGWNSLENLKGDLFTGVDDRSFVYFVHSYYAPVNDYTMATADFIQPFSAAMQKDNFYATQFHPEKSGKVGEQILANFLNLKV